MNKFEQLIEYVINDEEAKARELFHDIVVEKSRQIYEQMMEEEAIEEAKEEEEEEIEESKEEEEEVEESALKEESEEEEVEESVEEALGGSQATDLIDDIETEEQGMSMEGEGEEEMMADADLEDRVVDLEDKLDELMAEFEALMGDEGAGDEEEMDMDVEVGANDGMTDMEVTDDEMETEGMKMPMEEAVNLKAAPAPVKSEEAGINKKSPNANNSGGVGAVAKPVHVTGETAQGRSAPSTKDLIGKVQNTPAQSTVKMDSAPKPVTAQASGVNTRTPFPKA